MHVKPFIAKRPRVEMVPLIDMFFLLLVFFLFGVFSMTMQQGLTVELPAASTGTTTEEESMTISVSEDGAMRLNQRPVTLETLPAALAQARQVGRSPIVLIHADRRVPHGTVITVLDQVRQAGLQRVSFQTASAGAAAVNAQHPGVEGRDGLRSSGE